jgi:nucleotide-binding universal stress UspA family protein
LIFSSNSITLLCVILVEYKVGIDCGRNTEAPIQFLKFVNIFYEFHRPMKKILVPIDLRSDYANVIDYATAVASRAGARIVVYYAAGRSFLNKPMEQRHACEQDDQTYTEAIRNKKFKERVKSLFSYFKGHGVAYDFHAVAKSSVTDLIQHSHDGNYDLMIMGTDSVPGIWGYVQSAYASRLIGAVNVPVLLVPANSRFDEIGDITYAVDLTDYDPHVIRQVKAIAAMFDAKLTIAHVNPQEDVKKEAYLSSLERTISDTLDYPKVYYKFFDHVDTVSGIKKFVQFNNTQVVAMINRKRFSWGDIFSDRSLTRKMSRELTVPLLAFAKYSA